MEDKEVIETATQQQEDDQPKEKKTVRDHMYGRIDVKLSSVDRFIKILLALLVISVILGVLM